VLEDKLGAISQEVEQKFKIMENQKVKDHIAELLVGECRG
jgi:hypothetical protein